MRIVQAAVPTTGRDGPLDHVAPHVPDGFAVGIAVVAMAHGEDIAVLGGVLHDPS